MSYYVIEGNKNGICVCPAEFETVEDAVIKIKGMIDILCDQEPGWVFNELTNPFEPDLQAFYGTHPNYHTFSYAVYKKLEENDYSKETL